MSIGRHFIRYCLSALAWVTLSVAPAVAADGGARAAVDDALIRSKAAGHPRPIVATVMWLG